MDAVRALSQGDRAGAVAGFAAAATGFVGFSPGLAKLGIMGAMGLSARAMGRTGRSVFGETRFTGLVQNRQMSELTQTQIRNAFRSTPFAPTDHAISRMQNQRTQNLGVRTLNNLANTLNKGVVGPARDGRVSISRDGIQAIVDKSNMIVRSY